MKKLSVLAFSFAVIAFSAFSTASAQDLSSAWLEYENARNTMYESWDQLDASWTVFEEAWQIGVQQPKSELARATQVVTIAASDVSRAVFQVNNTLGTTITFSPQVTGQLLRISFPARAYNFRQYTPEPTGGSAEELQMAFAALNEAWVYVDGGWAELSREWTNVAGDTRSIRRSWQSIEEEWVRINVAWAEVDAAYASQ